MRAMLLLLFCANAVAQPVVNSASLQGQTLTVTGSGFGIGKTPLLWDNFESGADGATLNGSPQSGTWALNGGTSYTTAQAHSGTKSAFGSRTTSSQWANFNVDMPDGINFYQSFWFRYNYPAGDTGQAKLSQIHGTYGIGDYNPGVMTGGFSGTWWASYIALENSGMVSRINFPSNYPGVDPAHPNGDNPPLMNTWHHFEVILKQSTVNIADGSIIIKINGGEVYRQEPTKTRERAGQRWNLAEFFTGMTNFSSPTYTWIDDVYLSDSWARLEIGDQLTYAQSLHRELQAVTNWSAGSIGATFNLGSFQTGQTVYVFVVDANGNASAGVAVNGSPPPPALPAPTNLRVL